MFIEGDFSVIIFAKASITEILQHMVPFPLDGHIIAKFRPGVAFPASNSVLYASWR